MSKKSNLLMLLILMSSQTMGASFAGKITEVKECLKFNCETKVITQDIPCSFDFIAKYRAVGITDQQNFRGEHQWGLSGPQITKSSIIVDGVTLKMKKRDRPYMLKGNTLAYSLTSRTYTVSALFEYENGKELLPIEYLVSKKVESDEISKVYKCELF